MTWTLGDHGLRPSVRGGGQPDETCMLGSAALRCEVTSQPVAVSEVDDPGGADFSGQLDITRRARTPAPQETLHRRGQPPSTRSANAMKSGGDDAPYNARTCCPTG